MKRAFFVLVELLGLNAFFRWLNRGKIRVLLYHSVIEDGDQLPNAVSKGEFEHHLVYLKQHANVVALSADGQWENLSDKKLNVLITFDDGFENNATIAAPLLEKYGFRSVFFAIANLIEKGTKPKFMEKLGDTPMVRKYGSTVTVELIQAMVEKRFTFGSHSLEHQDFSNLTSEQAADDFQQSRTRIEAVTGQSCELFAFPWGRHLPEQLDLGLSTYQKLFLVKHGLNRAGDRILCRNEVNDSWQMKAALSGALDFFRASGKLT